MAWAVHFLLCAVTLHLILDFGVGLDGSLRGHSPATMRTLDVLPSAMFRAGVSGRPALSPARCLLRACLRNLSLTGDGGYGGCPCMPTTGTRSSPTLTFCHATIRPVAIGARRYREDVFDGHQEGLVDLTLGARGSRIHGLHGGRGSWSTHSFFSPRRPFRRLL